MFENIRFTKKNIVYLIIGFSAPFGVIFLLNSFIVVTSFLVSNIPNLGNVFMNMNFNEPIKVSEYITIYIAVVGIEVTALLTLAIHNLSISNENKQKIEKIQLSTKKVYNDFVESLDHLFSWYTSNQLSNPKHFYLSENWNDLLLDLNTDKACWRIYRELYLELNDINKLIENGDPNSAEPIIYDLFKKLSMDFYNYYKKQIGNDINFKCVLKPIYIDAIKQISPTNNRLKQQFKYNNGDSFYSMTNGKYTVYDSNKKLLCECTFKENQPYTGYAKLFDKENVRFDGNINEGTEIEGTLYNYRIDLLNNNKLFEDKLQYVHNFRDRDYCERNKINSGNIVRVATLTLKDNKYEIIPQTIRDGRYSIF